MVTMRTTRWLCAGLDATFSLLLLAIPTAGVFLWVTWPIPAALDRAVADVPNPVAPPEVQTELAWYAPLWERDLAQPMVDPPFQQPAQQPQPTSPLPHLVATLVDAEFRYAHLADRQGAVRLLEQDETIDGYRVTAIETDRVQLQRGDALVWVEVPKEKR